MTKRLRTISIPAAAVLQFCTAVAAPQVDRPTEAVTKPPLPPSAAPARSLSDTEIDARIRKEVLDKLASELESRYAIEATAKRLSDLVRAKQRSNAYRTITTAPALARALTDDLLAVAHDKHLRVSFSFAPLPQNPSGPLSQEVLNQIRKQNGAIPKVEILDGNVGYMRVNGVPPLDLTRSAVGAAFAFLHNTDALIIDNRGNGGGDPNTVALYVSYLSEGEPYLVNTFHWREGNRIVEFKTTDLGDLTYGAHKPVFVLTSPATFSGGEELSYDLQALKRAVIVGEVTGGGANPGGPIPLGHQFVVNMPSGQPVNPITGTNWEGIGVKPDIPLSSAAALSRAHALAIERLTVEAPDPVSRSMLNAVAMKLESLEEAKSAGVTRLANADLLGTYALEGGPGATVTILEKEGRLVQRVDGFPDVALVFLNGNRYKPEGFPDGFITSFRVKEGRAELLLEVPFGPPTIRAKR
jgi:Peptidase family S41/N-terminal domain of Peptidase_S41 in eukaryotic IRBP